MLENHVLGVEWYHWTLATIAISTAPLVVTELVCRERSFSLVPRP